MNPSPQDARAMLRSKLEVAATLYPDRFAQVRWRRLLNAVIRELQVPREDVSINKLLGALDVGPDECALRLFALDRLYFFYDDLSPTERSGYIDLQPPEIQARLPGWLAEVAQEQVAAQKRAHAFKDEAELLGEWSGSPSARVVVAYDELQPWLTQQSPDTWHKVATSWNYDRDVGPLAWIIQQSQCDRATASHLYLANAYQFIDKPTADACDFDPQVWLMLRDIAANWMAGRYVRAQLQWEPETNLMDLYQSAVSKLNATGRSTRWHLAADEIKPLAGRKPDSPYTYQDGDVLWTFAVWRERVGK